MIHREQARFAALVAGMGAAMLLAACAPTAAPSPPAAPAAAPAAQPAPQAPAQPQAARGGTVRYACISEPNHLNPYVSASTADRRGMGPIYESLLQVKSELGTDYRIEYASNPWLAEKWEQPDPTTYIFAIRRGVKWQDGADFTGEDVVFSFNYGRDPANAFAIRRTLDGIKNVELLDPYRVKITLTAPSNAFLRNLADQNLMILPKHVHDRGDSFQKVAVGTGPFVLKEFAPGKLSSFTRNSNYWQPGKPNPEGVECLYSLDRAAMLAAFAAQEIDLLHVNDRPQLNTLLQTLPKTQWEGFQGELLVHLYPKSNQPPFDDVRVRRAMHLAIDREGLVKAATFGEGLAAPPVVPPNKTGYAIPPEELAKLPGYRTPKEIDWEEARRLLPEAGYPSGFKTSILYSRQHTITPRMAEPIASHLGKVGIEGVLDGVPTATFNKRESDGDYEVMFGTFADSTFTRPRTYLHSTGSLNKAGIKDPELDRLLDIIDQESDTAKVKAAALALQRLMLDKVYAIPGAMLPAYATWQPWVHDYHFNRGSAEFIDQLTAARIWLDVGQMPAKRKTASGQ